MEIPLSRGLFAIIDDEDFEKVKDYSWYASCPYPGFFYAVGRRPFKKGAKSDSERLIAVRMHRLIMDVPRHLIVHHKNGDTLDNRKKNLEICTSKRHSQIPRQRRKTSKYKGVYFEKNTNKWKAQIMVNGKRRNIGRFADEKIAAIAYDVYAKEHFGKDAVCNILYK